MKPTVVFIYIVSVIAVLLLLNGCAVSATPKPKPILCANNLSSPILNFCEVKPNTLWRGAKPDKNDTAWLINNGVKTIVNLELLYDDLDTLHEADVTKTGTVKIDYYRVQTWEPIYAVVQSIADQHVVHFLAIAKLAKQPLYVHCRAGENRTGVMVAAYKIILQGQTSPAQMTALLNEMQSYKGVWSTATTQYIKGLLQRRKQILQKVNAFTVEQPTQIICNNGKCVSNSQNSKSVQQN